MLFYLIFYVILCFYSTVKSSQIFYGSSIPGNDGYNHIKFEKKCTKDENVSSLKNESSSCTSINFEGGNLKSPIDVYGRVDFTFDFRDKDSAGELCTITVDNDDKKVNLTYSKAEMLSIGLSSVNKNIDQKDYDMKTQYFTIFYDSTKSPPYYVEVKNLNSNKKSFFLRPVIWGGFAVSAFLTYLFYWKYYKAV